MSLESALEEQIRDLKRKAEGVEEGIRVWTGRRNEAQRSVDREQARLDDINLMIEHLEASMPHNPPWKAGDRFRWRNYANDEGVVADVHDNSVIVRTDVGGNITMSIEEFGRRVERL